MQQQQVLSFREAMPEQQLWWTYATAGDFERAVREHLTDFVLELEPRAHTGSATGGGAGFSDGAAGALQPAAGGRALRRQARRLAQSTRRSGSLTGLS